MCLFLNVFKVVAVLNPLVAALIQRKSGSELIFWDSLHDPYPAHFEAVQR
jgi:hypothetical protein